MTSFPTPKPFRFENSWSQDNKFRTLLQPFWLAQTTPGAESSFPVLVVRLANEVPKWPLPVLYHLKGRLREIKLQLGRIDGHQLGWAHKNKLYDRSSIVSEKRSLFIGVNDRECNGQGREMPTQSLFTPQPHPWNTDCGRQLGLPSTPNDPGIPYLHQPSSDFTGYDYHRVWPIIYSPYVGWGAAQTVCIGDPRRDLERSEVHWPGQSTRPGWAQRSLLSTVLGHSGPQCYPDGWSSFFFFFCTATLPNTLNHTQLVLLPKCPNPKMPSRFQPISLCNVSYKII